MQLFGPTRRDRRGAGAAIIILVTVTSRCSADDDGKTLAVLTGIVGRAHGDIEVTTCCWRPTDGTSSAVDPHPRRGSSEGELWIRAARGIDIIGIKLIDIGAGQRRRADLRSLFGRGGVDDDRKELTVAPHTIIGGNRHTVETRSGWRPVDQATATVNRHPHWWRQQAKGRRGGTGGIDIIGIGLIDIGVGRWRRTNFGCLIHRNRKALFLWPHTVAHLDRDRKGTNLSRRP